MSELDLYRDTVTFRKKAYTVREITYAERREFIKLAESKADSIGAYLASRCTINEDGSRVFADESALDGKPPGLIDALSNAVLKLSGVDVTAKTPDSTPKND